MEPFSQSSSNDFTTPVNTTTPKKSKKSLLIFIIVLLVLGLGGFWFYRGYQTNQQQAQESEVTPTEALVLESPTPSDDETTPTPTGVVRGAVTSSKDLVIEVLNGSGEEGVAGKMRDHLSAKGYTNIEVGNADNFDYQGVEVRINDQYKKYLENVEADIKDAYTLSSDSGKIVQGDSDVDVTVIVGK